MKETNFLMQLMKCAFIKKLVSFIFFKDEKFFTAFSLVREPFFEGRRE